MKPLSLALGLMPHVQSSSIIFLLDPVVLLMTRIPQAQADVQHLWFGRRAATRIRSQHMAAIYDKSLKRKDFSGIVNDTSKKTQRQTERRVQNQVQRPKRRRTIPRMALTLGKSSI
jgi:hypothetical protein